MRLYGALVSLAVWIGLVPWELLRIALRRSSREILRQKLGIAAPASGPDAALLVHAVSAGEVAAAEAFIAPWLARHPDAAVILTTGTADGLSRAAELSRRHPGVRQPSYLPWDRPATMRRWLARRRPAAVAIVETEIWPGLFLAARTSGIPLALVSARLSPRDARRYRLARRFFANALESCQWIGAQNEEAAALFRTIGAPAHRLEVAGNLKLGGTPAPPLPPRLAAALEREGPLLVAGSTHAPEERGLLRILASLRRQDPRIRLVLAPRHPRRAHRVATAARKAGLTAARTSSVSPGQIWNVLVVDSMGLLASLYPFADLVFVGGSLARRGGHNPLEAATCGRPILVGPHTDNFREITEALEASGALYRARDFAHLEELVWRLLFDGEERAAMSRAGESFLESRRDVGVAYGEALTRLVTVPSTAPGFGRGPLTRKATIRLVEHEGSVCVLKDFAHDGRLFRKTWGALLARREAAAYRRLEGVTGVPRLLAMEGTDGLLLEWFEGKNCRERSPEDFRPEFFELLGETLGRVRSRGVLHGDVKRNVLWSRGRPILLDFGASFVIPRWLPLRSSLLRLAARYDARAVSKLKALVSPHLMTDSDCRRLLEPLPLQFLLRRSQTMLQRIYRRETGGAASA